MMRARVKNISFTVEPPKNLKEDGIRLVPRIIMPEASLFDFVLVRKMGRLYMVTEGEIEIYVDGDSDVPSIIEYIKAKNDEIYEKLLTIAMSTVTENLRPLSSGREDSAVPAVI